VTGQIPKYGAHFRRLSVPRDFANDLAHTEYVLKADVDWSIRANGTSEQWWVMYRGVYRASQTFSVMRDAMAACVAAHAALGTVELELHGGLSTPTHELRQPHRPWAQAKTMSPAGDIVAD
jgi:hypothetical protein